MDGNCDHCGKPLGDPAKVVAYDGCRFHMKCAIASESGEIPPIATSVGGLGLWGISTPYSRGQDGKG